MLPKKTKNIASCHGILSETIILCIFFSLISIVILSFLLNIVSFIFFIIELNLTFQVMYVCTMIFGIRYFDFKQNSVN